MLEEQPAHQVARENLQHNIIIVRKPRKICRADGEKKVEKDRIYLQKACGQNHQTFAGVEPIRREENKSSLADTENILRGRNEKTETDMGRTVKGGSESSAVGIGCGNPDDFQRKQVKLSQMAMMQSTSTDILLVGKTGCGKSATANTIVGRNAKPIFEPVNVILESFEGRNLKVVDVAGVANTSFKGQNGARAVAENASCGVSMNPKGFHAILFLLPYGDQYTQEDVDAVRILKDTFGPDFITKHGILLMTHGDVFARKEMMNFENWIAEQDGALKEIVQECGDRVILFDNKDEIPAVRSSQVKKLLYLIDQLPGKGVRYVPDIFNKANEVRREMEEKINQLTKKNCKLKEKLERRKIKEKLKSLGKKLNILMGDRQKTKHIEEELEKQRGDIEALKLKLEQHGVAGQNTSANIGQQLATRTWMPVAVELVRLSVKAVTSWWSG